MSTMHTFDRICRAMADPAFYPHPVSGIERRDTHISAVFLTGNWVYKLKKPLNFGFLDYTLLEFRRRMCEREIVLNQRLSSGIYEGVAAISRDGTGEFRLGEAGEVVEYAVKMRQLPDEAALSALLTRGKASGGALEDLGRKLARFYERSERGPEIERYGQQEAIAYNMEENFEQIRPFVGVLLPEQSWNLIREASRAFFRTHAHLFERRILAERIRDGHGDLRAEHVYFLDAIQIIDCIEFNERFRYGDIASDLAFLHMDIDRLGRPDLCLAVLSGYLENSGDYAVFSLLDFYACYRAIVKVKVACLMFSELRDAAQRDVMRKRATAHLDLACRYALQFSRPTIWVFCGLPGTGKSSLAEQIRDAFSIPLFQSDVVRTQLAEYRHTGDKPVPFGQGVFRLEMRAHVYGQMLALAQEAIKKGHSVILDATFALRKWRDEARLLATDLDTNIVFVECVSDEEIIRARLDGRVDGEGISLARSQHLPRISDQFDPLDEIPSQCRIVVDTGRPIEMNVREILITAYSLRRTQVTEALDRL